VGKGLGFGGRSWNMGHEYQLVYAGLLLQPEVIQGGLVFGVHGLGFSGWCRRRYLW
jgi:hypothetical protein